MQAFLDATGGLWVQGALVGKVGSAFTSTASQHGGQETTLAHLHTFFYHQGMVVAGVPYTARELLNLVEISGGTPYGATTIAGPRGERSPTANESRHRPLPGATCRRARRQAAWLSRTKGTGMASFVPSEPTPRLGDRRDRGGVLPIYSPRQVQAVLSPSWQGQPKPVTLRLPAGWPSIALHAPVARCRRPGARSGFWRGALFLVLGLWCRVQIGRTDGGLGRWCYDSRLFRDRLVAWRW